MKRKINLLFIIDLLLGFAGTEVHLYNLVKHIDKNKFNCFILTFNADEVFLEKFRAEGMSVFFIPVKSLYAPDLIDKAFKIRKIIKENNIDIVQTFHLISDTYGALVSRLSGVRHIISSRRDMGFHKKKKHIIMSKLANKLIERFINVCDAVADKISEVEHIPKAKQRTIYNGVDLKKYMVPTRKEIEKAREELGFSEDDFVVGIVGHMRPEKCHEVFFKGIKEGRKSIKHLKAIVIGGWRKHLDFFRNYCRELGMEDEIMFTGICDNVDKYIPVFDVACLVSSTEGLSNALLEYMAFARPLVVTAVGGNVEVVRDKENGILIPPHDHMALSDALIYLYANPSIRFEMGMNGRKTAENLFHMERMIEMHQSLYEEVLIH